MQNFYLSQEQRRTFQSTSKAKTQMLFKAAILRETVEREQ